VNDLIVNTLNSFSINPENDGYQQRRSKDDNEQEAIFFRHGITGGAILLMAKLAAYQGEIKIARLTKV
jgi:hypothetical protein